MQKFYDTCSLLNRGKEVFDTDEVFFISSITIKELEYIKDALNKDAEVKYQARQVLRRLDANEDKYEMIVYEKAWDEELKNSPILPDTDDSRIILTALHVAPKVKFISGDYLCYRFAKLCGLDSEYDGEDADDDYTGFATVILKTDEEMAMFYDTIYNLGEIPVDLYHNEYLFVKDKDGHIIDKYVNHAGKLIPLKDFPTFESKMFGKVKPKDEYQMAAMDSLQHNRITMLRGNAGTGKSMLALSYLISQEEKGEIDRIVIFCNTVATNGAARLGYYPGSKDEKLLDSQIGNFLVSKLGGDKNELVDQYIDTGKIVLLPFSDIRGYDTQDMKAGVYITEAQNLNIDMMKLALQRVGEDSIMILDGDSETQVDMGIYAGSNNGMRRVSQVYRGEDIYGEITLQKIYRSRIAEIAQRM